MQTIASQKRKAEDRTTIPGLVFFFRLKTRKMYPSDGGRSSDHFFAVCLLGAKVTSLPSLLVSGPEAPTALIAHSNPVTQNLSALGPSRRGCVVTSQIRPPNPPGGFGISGKLASVLVLAKLAAFKLDAPSCAHQNGMLASLHLYMGAEIFIRRVGNIGSWNPPFCSPCW